METEDFNMDKVWQNIAKKILKGHEEMMKVPSEKKPHKALKTFKEYFALECRNTLPELLKEEFGKDTKTTLVLLVYLLQQDFENKKNEIKPILIIDGDFKAFHESMAAYFKPYEIGSNSYYQNYLKDPEGKTALEADNKRREEKGRIVKLDNERSIESNKCKIKIRAILKSIDY